MADRLVLYDVDPVNPYGRELAALLAADGLDLTLVCSRAVEWVPAGVRARAVLAAPRQRVGPVVAVARRITGVLQAAPLMLRPGSVTVVVWSRDSWDRVVLAVIALLTRTVLVINHNPRRVRGERGMRGRALALLLRTAKRTVVHGDSLLEPAREEAAYVDCVTHPPYVEWRRRFAPATSSSVQRLLFLGQLRADKGVEEVPKVLDHLHGVDVSIVAAGAGVVPASWHEAAARAGIDVEVIGAGSPLRDEELGVVLAGGGLVVAPYVRATQSGSVLLALTCGLPVLAYASGELPALLTNESVVPVGAADELAARVRAFLTAPWPTAARSSEELAATCVNDWRRVLALTARGRRS